MFKRVPPLFAAVGLVGVVLLVFAVITDGPFLDEPDLTGKVIEVDKETFLLKEETTGKKPLCGEIRFGKGAPTEGEGEKAPAIRPGIQVEVWLEGPVAESYPCQAQAKRIRILESR